MLEKLAKLIDVKSIMTLGSLTAGFVRSRPVAEIFATIGSAAVIREVNCTMIASASVGVWTVGGNIHCRTQEAASQELEEVIHLSPDSAGLEPERNYHIVFKGKRG